jgi:hypothetical protein
MSKKINWGYYRNGLTSCKRAQEVLDARNISVENRVIANKEKIDSKAAWELLQSSSLIRTGKGNKTNVWNPSIDAKEEILKDVIGPSGNLRAPAWRVGTEYIVGFNPELYQEMFG